MIDTQFLTRYCISRKDNIRDGERGGGRNRQHIVLHSAFARQHVVLHWVAFFGDAILLNTLYNMMFPLRLLRCHRNAMLPKCDSTPAPWLNMRIPQHASGWRPPWFPWHLADTLCTGSIWSFDSVRSCPTGWSQKQWLRHFV